MLVYGLTTGHKIGLGVVALVFVLFALSSSFVFPRFRSTFPGRGLPAFIIVSFVFFFAMLTAVEVFGAEAKEEHESEGRQEVAEPTTETTTTPARNTPGTTGGATTTASTPSGKPKTETVKVTESEFEITLPSKKLKAGSITFDVTNAGKSPHNLVVVGNGVSEKTPIFNGGRSEQLKVDLKPGTYELYCSVPGHKQAGMDTHVTVTK